MDIKKNYSLTDPIPVRAGNTTGGHDGEVDLIEINGGYHVARRNASEVLIVKRNIWKNYRIHWKLC